MKPFPVILSAPSGGGKTTIARELLRRRADVGYSVSCTTRPPRPGEEHGRDYYFLSPEEFAARRARGEFAECAEVHGRHMYGTLRSEVERVLASGRHVLMDIDVQGAVQFAGAFPESVLVFLIPPSAAVLRERLSGRMTEDDEAVSRRLRTSRDELRAVREYQYVIVNDELAHACDAVGAVIDAEAVRRTRQPDLARRIEALVEELEQILSVPITSE
ncbi:MAG TPA: guanylate kinase [Gemmatimonadaceae bacterium]|nr:guanylate kinase [Gemmatimonadaceae bacterium]